MPDSAQRDHRSGAARAREEHRAVQVHVELDRGEPAWRRVDDPAEGGETPFGRARLPRVADVVVRAVLGLADPHAGRLRGRAVGAEVIPAARGPAGQPGAGDPVLSVAAQLGAEALAIPVVLLDDRAG